MQNQNDRLLRLSQIIGNKKAKPPIPAIIPISRAAWWAGVKSGRYPASVKLSGRVTCWRESEIMQIVSGDRG